MMRAMRSTALVAIAVLFLGAQQAQGGAVRVDFGGSVTSIIGSNDVADPVARLGGSIHEGDRFSGYFTFDDSAPSFSTAPDEVTYAFLTPAWTLNSHVGDLTTVPASWEGYDIGGVGYTITVSDGVMSGVFVAGFFQLDSPGPIGPGDVAAFQLNLYGPLSSTSLSDVSFAPDAFTDVHGSWTIDFADGSGVEIGGNIDTPWSNAVPESGSAALVAIAGAAFALLGFRRARS
jgi:hypothetical protein